VSSLKVISPTLKERKRYILFKIHSDTEISKDTIAKQCTEACLRFLGEFGCAEAGVQFLPETWDKKTQTGIIKTGHKWVDQTKSALILIKEINGKKTTLSTISTSGTIDKVKGKRK
jgi:ribonuclease P/MRP protein subunit POP5